MKLSYSPSHLALYAFYGAILFLKVLLVIWSPNFALALVLVESVVFLSLLQFILKPSLSKEASPPLQLDEAISLTTADNFTFAPISEAQEVMIETQEVTAADEGRNFLEEANNESPLIPIFDVQKKLIDTQEVTVADGENTSDLSKDTNQVPEVNDPVKLDETIHLTMADNFTFAPISDNEFEFSLQAKNIELNKRLAELAGTLQACLPVIDIQNNQLLSVNQDTEEAALKIVSGIMEVRQSITAMISELTVRGTENDQAVEQSSVAMEQFKELQQYVEHRFGEISNNLERDQTQLDEVVLTTKALAEYVKSAGAITSQIKMLALNTTIVAAGVGEHGLGFSVIAKEMRYLSDVSKEATENIANQIERITSGMEIQIKERLIREASSGDVERKVLGDLEKQFGRYVEVVAGHAEVIQETTDKNQLLSGKVMDILAGIQFQDITRQKVEQIIKSLSFVKDQFNQAVTDCSEFAIPESESNKNVDTLFDTYVMNEQRITHLKTIGKMQNVVIEEKSLPAIEFF